MAVAVVFLMVVSGVELVAAAAAPPPPVPEPVACSLPNTSMVSPNYCNAYDEDRMDSLTQSCEMFLTDAEAAPTKDCCAGLNTVASNRTACVCKLTFYPPAHHDAARQLDLPRLCGVTTNLCGQCPTFLVSVSNGTAPTTPSANAPFSEGKSTASTVGAISLAVVCGVLLVVGIVTLSIILIKKRKAKKNPPEAFEAPPPGGAF